MLGKKRLRCWVHASCLLLVALLAVADGAESDEKSQEMFTRTVPVEQGDRCIVCNTPLRTGDTVYLVEGQRVGIMEEMEPQLFSEPLRYLARLKPRGGLFGGEVAPAGGISDAWLFLGIYVILGLAFGAVCAHRALNTGQSPIRWFAAGLLLNVFGYLALLVRSADQEAPAGKYKGVIKIPSTAEPQQCPHCSALNHPAAQRCSACGRELTPVALSETARLHPSRN